MATWRPSLADRDAQGRIKLAADTTEAAQLYEETRQAISGEEAEPDEAPPPRRRALAQLDGDMLRMIVAVVLLLVGALVWGALRQGATSAPPPLTAPTSAPTPTTAPTMAPAPVLQDAYASPGGALLGTTPLTTTIAYQHSAWPGWAGVAWQGGVVWVRTDATQLAHLPDLAPLPTAAPPPTSAPPPPAAAPDRGCDPTVNPIYAVEHDVTGPHGEPLGHVRGVSCDSQTEAQANADVLADGVLSNVATADAAARPQPTMSAK